MTRFLLAGALFVCRPFAGHSQGVTTWVEELAALRTLEQTVTQGYNIIKNELGNIGDIRYDEYQLHSAYYGSLATVNPALQTDPKTVALTELLSQLVQRLQTSLAYWQSQQPIDQP
jgi:hypothetical protein